ncbi:MAG: glycosyltransferase family 39 protein [Chloroflexota bacterium]|nr:glycosyltransferase family 39 protein [Chloroflexota bacterium]
MTNNQLSILNDQRSPKHVFFIILLIYLILAVAYSVVVPLAEAPDEADHYAYLRYIGVNRGLAEGPTVTQSKHPPLYHAIAGGLTGWTGLDFDFLRSNPDAVPLGPDKPPNFFVHTTLEDFPWQRGPLAMHLARGLSIVFGAVTLWATWALGREVFPEREAIGLLAAAFLAGLPGFLFISSAINNDNAAGAFAALAMLLSAQTVRRGLSTRRSLLLGIVLGLGALSKVGTLAIWPLAGLAILATWWLERSRSSWKALLGHLLLVFGLGALLASPWYLRNWRLYGDPFGWELVRMTIDQRLAPLAPGDIRWLLWGLHRTFWGRFGGAGQIQLPAWAYAAAAFFGAALLVGIVRYLEQMVKGGSADQRIGEAEGRKDGERGDSGVSDAGAAEMPSSGAYDRSELISRKRQLGLLILLAAAPALIFVTLVRYSAIALGTDQARLLWPALSAIAVWVGVGVVGLLDWVYGGEDQAGAWRVGDLKLVGVFTLFMALFGLAALLGVIRPAFAAPQPLSSHQAPVRQPLALFGGTFELVDTQLPGEPIEAGQPAAVRLVWQATSAISADLRPSVRLVHSDGWLAAEWTHAPADGRYSTDHWQPDEPIADDYLLVPEPGGSGDYQVEVSVRPFAGPWLPEASGSTGFEDRPAFVIGSIEYR